MFLFDNVVLEETLGPGLDQLLVLVGKFIEALLSLDYFYRVYDVLGVDFHTVGDLA